MGQGASRIPRASRTAFSSQSLIAPSLFLNQGRARSPALGPPLPHRPLRQLRDRRHRLVPRRRPQRVLQLRRSLGVQAPGQGIVPPPYLEPAFVFSRHSMGLSHPVGKCAERAFRLLLFSPTSCEDVGISLRLRWLVARAGERRTRRGIPVRIICAQAPVHTVPKSHHSPAARWVAERMANHSCELYRVHMAHAAILLSRLRSSTKRTSPVRDPISLTLNSSARCAPSQMCSSRGVSRRATLSLSTCP